MNELKDVLSEFADEVKAVDLRQRALATSRRIGVRRNITLTAAAMCAVAVAGALVLNTTAQGNALPVASQPVISSTLQPIVLPASGGGDYSSWTSIMPGFKATIPGCESEEVRLDGQPKLPGIQGYESVDSDVDQDGTTERVVSVECGPNAVMHVVALQMVSGQYQFKAFVVSAGAGLKIAKIEAAGPGRIKVLVYKGLNEPPHSPFQWRTYAWQKNRFRQVDGPTSFPASQPAATLAVDSATVTFSKADDVRYHGQLKVSVANTGVIAVRKATVAMYFPLNVRPTGRGWDNCSQDEISGSWSIRCDIGELPAGARRDLSFEVVADGLPGTDVEFKAYLVQSSPYVLESTLPIPRTITVKLQ